MIRFPKADLLSRAAVLPAGYVDRLVDICVSEGEDLLVELAQLDALNEQSRQAAIARYRRDAATVAALEAICAACEWNVEWVCEHPGCQPCRQRSGGGLKRQIANAAYQCPAARWPQ